MRNFIFVLILFFLVSCGATRDMNFADISTQNNDITGEYKNLQDDKNIIFLLDRKLLKDTINRENIYEKFTINTDKKHLYISIYQNNGEILNRKYKYKKQKGIYYLKNQNVKPLLVPFIFGAIDEKRLYLYKNTKGNLSINVYQSRAGAALLIVFLDWKNKSYFAEFEKINKKE